MILLSFVGISLIFIRLKLKRSEKLVDLDNFILKLKLLNKNEIKYLKLRTSNCKILVLKLSISCDNLLFCERVFVENIKFLYLISDCVDRKINETKLKFRGLKNISLIESFAISTCNHFLKSQKFQMIKFIKSIDKKMPMQKKELMLFKFVLAKYIIEMICNIEKELIEIRNIIILSKTAKSLQKYRKKILNLAQNYSICKFNYNLTKKLQNTKFPNNTEREIKSFLRYLFYCESLLKKSILYLKLFFE